MTLHEAMLAVLRTAPGARMTARELCDQINRRGLYRMRDGRPVEIQQIHARAGNYSHLFVRVGDGIALRSATAEAPAKRAAVPQAPESATVSRSPRRVARATGAIDSDDVAASLSGLLRFLERGLTTTIADLEYELVDCDPAGVPAAVAAAGIDAELLRSAVTVRRAVGRLNDVIHAATISLALAAILEPGERIVVRPSLAAGNDKTRHYDLETDRRIAEFKVSFWKGADAMRQRGVFADLVALALDDSGRRAQLFVVGSAPIRYLRTSRATAEWALNRSSPLLRARFEERFGPLSVPVGDFTAGPGGAVELVDVTTVVPALAPVSEP